MSTIIGRKIRQLRLMKNLKLKDLSQSTGLSISYLSKLERENYTASPGALKQIADALDVTVEFFYEGPSVIRSYERITEYVADEMISVEKLTSNAKDCRMAATICNVFPGNAQMLLAPHSHEGEEIAYVLEGTLTVQLNGIEHVLYPGDCLRFPSEHSHLWINNTNQMVRFLSISTSPQKWASYRDNKAKLLDDEPV